MLCACMHIFVCSSLCVPVCVKGGGDKTSLWQMEAKSGTDHMKTHPNDCIIKAGGRGGLQ